MLDNIPDEIIIAFIFIVGLSFGSFVTLASYRMPRGEEIIFGSSRCTKCGHNLGFFDLFPVLSWCFRGGKCGYCGVHVSVRYPLIEIMTGLLVVVTYLKMGISYPALIIALLGVFLMILVVVDLEHKIIPDQIQLMMLVLGIVYRIIPETRDIQQLVIGPIAGVSAGLLIRYIFSTWKKQEALGMGDVKFLVIVGIFLQKELIITFLFLAGVVGILTALLWSAVEKGKQFPFGPSLAVALYFCILMPEMQGVIKEYVTNILFDEF